MCAGEIVRPLRWSTGDLLNRVIELAEEACFCGLTALAVPRAIFIDLENRVLEKLKMHYR